MSMTMPASKSIVHLLSIVDGESEETVKVVMFQSFVEKEFHRQFDVDPESDPEMLDRYSVGPDDVAFLNRYLEGQLEFDFTRFAYFVEAVRDE